MLRAWLGIEYYERNVVNQLIEFMNYYITETVSEAKQYRDYARKSTIDVADIRLAIGSKSCDTFTRPLPMSSIR
jgi:histone H3/H4